MARNISPFAALTHGEQQIKWLEYQSIRLPYSTASIETQPCATETVNNHNEEPPAHTSEPVVSPKPAAITPPPEVFYRSEKTPPVQKQGIAALTPAGPASQMEQKTRHRQYDAVIEKMKLAERKAGCYHSWSK